MNILLLNPTRTGKDTYVTAPLHLIYIATVIEKAGHRARIVDIHYKFRKNQKRIKSKLEFENEMIKEILAEDFDVLGIGSVVSAFDFSKRVVTAIKQNKPDIPVIIGGGLGMAVKDLWLKQTNVDFLVESDGELVIQEFLKAYPDKDKLMKIPGLHMRDNGNFISHPPRLPKNLDYIDYPNWDILDNFDDYMDMQKSGINDTLPSSLQLSDNDRVLPIVMTRGCPYNCTFCYHMNHLYRTHSIQYIINYISYLKQKYLINFIATWDDIIMADTNWLHNFCDELALQKIGVRFFTSGGKPNLIDQALARKMKQSGFIRIRYGIESGSQKMLNIMKKETTVSQNYDAVKITLQEDIFVHLNMVVGMPGENLSTLKETSNFLLSLAKEGVITSKNVSFSYATGYPGAELYKYMIEHKIVTDTETYLKEQTGVVEYKYNLCGINKRLLHFIIIVMLLKIDFFYSLSTKKYFQAAKNIVVSSVKFVVLLFLPANIRAFLKKILGMRFEKYAKLS